MTGCQRISGCWRPIRLGAFKNINQSGIVCHIIIKGSANRYGISVNSYLNKHSKRFHKVCYICGNFFYIEFINIISAHVTDLKLGLFVPISLLTDKHISTTHRRRQNRAGPPVQLTRCADNHSITTDGDRSAKENINFMSN